MSNNNWSTKRVTKKQINGLWYGGYKPKGDYFLERDGSAMILYLYSRDWKSVEKLSTATGPDGKLFHIEESERRGGYGRGPIQVDSWHKYTTYPLAYRLTRKEGE